MVPYACFEISFCAFNGVFNKGILEATVLGRKRELKCHACWNVKEVADEPCGQQRLFAEKHSKISFSNTAINNTKRESL